MAADPEAEKTARASVEAWKAERDETEVAEALAALAAAAKTETNLMAPDPGRRPRGCDHGGVGCHPARGVRRVPRPDRRQRRGRRRGGAPS